MLLVESLGTGKGNCEDRQKRTQTETNGKIENWKKDAGSA
jgi:hypothetical protein